MLGTIIARLGLPFLVSVIGGALGSVNNPVAKSAAEALESFDAAYANGAITAEQMAEANRHAEKMAELKAREYESALTEVNQSLRAEAQSSDVYVRRMRPTFGYLMAFTWAAQMMAIAYIMVFDSERIEDVLRGMEGLSTIWAVALSVLGIYVYKRSEEKRVVMPPAAPAAPSVAKPAAKPKVNE